MPQTTEQSNIRETMFHKFLPTVKNVVRQQLGFHLSEEEITSITQRICEEREEDISEFCISLESIDFSKDEHRSDVNDTIENIIIKELTEKNGNNTPAKKLEDVRTYFDVDWLGYRGSLGFLTDIYKGEFPDDFLEDHYRTIISYNEEGRYVAVWDLGNQHCSYIGEFESLEHLKNYFELINIFP